MIKKYMYSILTALLILCLSLLKPIKLPELPIKLFTIDKLEHFIMYGFFMAVIIFECGKNIKTIKNLFLTALIPAFFGILMELFQSFIPFRKASLYDCIANCSGVIFAIIIYLIINLVRTKLFSKK